jgi:hypothetical protein
VTTSKAPTIMRENPRRHTAIATGSAADNRTNGPANEIPRSASANTQNGFLDIIKKEPVRGGTGSF